MIYLYALSTLASAQDKILRHHGLDPHTVWVEWCYVIEPERDLNGEELDRLAWLLQELGGPLPAPDFSPASSELIIGPQLGFETPWGSTARTIATRAGVPLARVERFRRYRFDRPLGHQGERLAQQLHDRMTEAVYVTLPLSLESGHQPEPVVSVAVLTQGIVALQEANTTHGLAMDEQDLDYYLGLFNRIGRDPSMVELFQLGQGNSEHSRHGFFRGRLVIDGQAQGFSLMDVVKAPYLANPNNSLIAFHDDSSAIRGVPHIALTPVTPGKVSVLRPMPRLRHPTLTAETHNFPTGVAPYPGAGTGTGGRIRDNQAVGRGGLVVASGVGYFTGNLHVPGYDLPWEQDGRSHPDNLAQPLQILIEASNGASAYGNCFGEPVILGHVRTFGMWVGDGYRAAFKPVMYTAGYGQIDDAHLEKGQAKPQMLIVQLGGPAYRIGVGGGAASSMSSGENTAELDFNAVQRPDPEMEQRMNRVMRACVELGTANPIASAHDLGAGGDSNALPEIADPAGARIDLRAIPCGDPTMSVMEIWGNESQERTVTLIRPRDLETVEALCRREAVPCAVVGEITGDGQLVVFDTADGTTPVNLPLEPILGAIPLKTIKLQTVPVLLRPLELPDDLTVRAALDRVFRLVSVGSKGWLTNKVDRSVTGLIAQQQGVGPFDLPLADFGAVGLSVFDQSGVAGSQGERPLVGLISPAAQGRMTVGEALTNLMGAKVTALPDIRCSANWMWAAKLPGEGARLVEAALSMRDIMLELGMAVDGGKDSLSMASKDTEGTVKAPGQLVISTYAVMPDVARKVTPDFKRTGNRIFFIDLAAGRARLGGSALAQTFQQLGDDCPDVDDVSQLKAAFQVVQELVEEGLVASLHDRSDGGLATTLIEMCIGGNVGARFDLYGEADVISAFFAEELGVVLEVADPVKVAQHLAERCISFRDIGNVGEWEGEVTVSYNGQTVLGESIVALRSLWAETSSKLEVEQANPATAAAEAAVLSGSLAQPAWDLGFTPRVTPASVLRRKTKPKLAVLREQGSNGDRELAAAFIAAGFEVTDVTMTDLLEGRANLDMFRGVAFPGGFSFGDVLGSAKGWAGSIRFNPALAEQLQRFYARSDTFSLGVCNGFQLATLIGWVPTLPFQGAVQPQLVHNRSERFESRRVTVTILGSPAIMLQGMEGSTLGVWVAHGEGRLVWPHIATKWATVGNNLAPIRYVDPAGDITEQYPFNPNGSELGIAGLCSADGRHLAMMPHTERLTNQRWQWPWMPSSWSAYRASPWLRMFQNAYNWCVNN